MSRAPRLSVLPLEERAVPATITVLGLGDAAPTPLTPAGADFTAIDLRSAIDGANKNPGADAIVLPTGTITLTVAGADEDAAATGDLDITEAVTITGAGAGLTVVNAAGLDRVFDVSSSATAVALSGLTVTGGQVGGTSSVRGGGIRSAANSLTLTGVTVSNNTVTLSGGEGTVRGGGVSANNLTISDSTISGNTARAEGSYSSARGGGVEAIYGLTLTRSTVSGNTAIAVGSRSDATGGGVSAALGDATLTESAISGNRALAEGGASSDALGGGMAHRYGDSLTIAGGRIEDNQAIGSSIDGGSAFQSGGSARGGGLYTYDVVEVTLTGVTVAGNRAAGGSFTSATSNGNSGGFASGGGLFISGGEGATAARIVRSTVSGNVAVGGDLSVGTSSPNLPRSGSALGAGVSAAYAVSLEVTNSTVSGNSARSGDAAVAGGAYGGDVGEASGGGLNVFGSLALLNSTVALNTSVAGAATGNANGNVSYGGGIFAYGGNGSGLLLRSTVVALNDADSSPDAITFFSDLNAASSLIGDGDGTGIVDGENGNQVGTAAEPIDPLLGPLADNGGPTLTHTPLAGSPLLDAGSNEAELEFDQRGTPFARVVGTGPDIGALEVQPPTTVLSVTRGQPSPTSAATLTFTVTFSQPVRVSTADIADFLLTATGTAAGTVSAVAPVGTGPEVTSFTVTVSGVAGTGTLRLDVPATAMLTDQFAAPVVLPFAAGEVYDIDRDAPSVSAEQAAGQVDPTNAGTILFTLVFSEPVTGLGSGGLTIGGTAGATTAAVTGSGTTYTVAVSGMVRDGTVTLSVNPGAAQDAVANGNLASTSADNTVTFDGTPPTVTLTSGSPDPTNGSIAVTVQFSEAVTGFDATDIAPTGGTVTGFTAVDGDTYTFTFVPDTQGTVSVTVPAGAGQDAATNASLASNTLSRVFDSVAPTVTVTPADGQPNPATGGPIRFTVVFSEPVTGFDASDLIPGGAAAGLVPTVTGSGTTYTVTFAAPPAAGTLTLGVRAGAGTDAAGNPSAAGAAGSVTFAPPAVPPADLPPVDQGAVDIYAAASGNAVNVYSPDGELLYTVRPFTDAESPGGVRVAVADITGDGTPDLVAVTGPGTRTVMRVIDGATRRVVREFRPFEDAFAGGGHVAAADVNGDRFADIAVAADRGGAARVTVFSGRDGSQLANFYGIEDADFRGGARPAFADVDGDGVADLIVAAGFRGGPRVALYDGTTLRPGRTPQKFFADFFVFEDTLRDGAFVTGGDLDGDGFGDLVAGGGPKGGPRVLALSGADLLAGLGKSSDELANFFAGDPTKRDSVRVTVKDFDGDGLASLITGAGTDSPTDVTVFGQGDIEEDDAFEAFPGAGGGVFVG